MPKLITASYKQRNFVKGLLKHGSIKKAAMESYDTTERNAYLIGRQALANPNTQAYMKRLMDEHRVTDDLLVDTLKAMIEAGSDPKVLSRMTAGDLLGTIREVAKLKDLYPAEKKKIEKKTLSIKLEGKTTEEIKELIDEKVNRLKGLTKLLENDKAMS